MKVIFVIDKLRVTGVTKLINSECSEMFIFHNSGHEEFIKLIEFFKYAGCGMRDADAGCGCGMRDAGCEI